MFPEDRYFELVTVSDKLVVSETDVQEDELLEGVLEEVEKPGNVGAVVRSADGAGATAVVVADGNTDLYNPNTIRASLGTIFTLPVVAASTAETIAWLGRHQLHVPGG